MHSMTKTLCLLLSFLFLPCTQSNAYISFLSLWTKGDKRVVVIGDAHTPNKTDAEHKEIIVPFIEQLAERAEKSQVIVEDGQYTSWDKVFNPNDNNFSKFDKYSYVRLLSWITSFAKYHKYRYKSLVFSLSDVRFNFDSFASLFKQSPSEKSCGLVNDIDFVLEALASFKAELPTEKAKKICSELEEDIKVYKESLIELQKTYKEKNIITCMEKASRDTGNTAKVEELYKDPIDYAIADVGFIMDLIRSQENYKTTFTFTGSNHSVVIDTMLEALGYKRVGPHLGKSLKNELPYPISTKEVEKFLSSTLQTL